MLIALITYLLLGGGPEGMMVLLKDSEKQIKIVVPRGEAQKMALDVLKVGKRQTKDFTKSRKKATKELTKILGNHEVDLTTVDDLWSDVHKANYEFSLESVELRFMLKQHLSREQWSQVFPANTQ